MSNSLWPHGLYSPWNPPGLNTGVGSLSLLQGGEVSDAGRDWGQEEKGTTEDEMAGWHH